MTVPSPLVSVIIPLFNHEKFIEEAVRSVLRQTHENFEVIVVDDGSSDKSGDIVKAIDDTRIIYLAQVNQGAHSAINRGIKLAKGEYVAVLNSDDVYQPTRLEEFVRIMNADSSVFCVFSAVEHISERGEPVEVAGIPEEIARTLKGGANIVADLLTENFFVTTSNLFCRREVFDEIGGFLNLKYAHDYEFFLRLCYRFKVLFCEKALVKYRHHSSNTIRENEAAVSFEVGLILAHFFLNYDLRRVFDHEDDEFGSLLKVLRSMNTRGADRIIVTLLLYGMIHREKRSEILEFLTSNLDSLFRKACIDYLRESIDSWHASQGIWQKVHELEERLTETEQRLVKTSEEAKEWWQNSKDAWRRVEEGGERLQETEQRLQETEQRLVKTSEEAKEWWQNSKDAWRKVEEEGRRLQETEQRLAETSEEAKKWWLSSEDAWRRVEEAGVALSDIKERLRERTEELEALTNSKSFRLGRALTWPLRAVKRLAAKGTARPRA